MDQARRLREMMGVLDRPESKKNLKKDRSKKRAKVISVSSGKGGVGKSNFTINTAIAMSKKGYKVAILDADIGLGNIEILTGINMKHSISDIIFNNRNILNIIEEGPEGVKLISGGSGLQELAIMDGDNFEKVIHELMNLDDLFDYIFIDTGAGISRSVIDFIMASDAVAIVTTPDPTAIMDSYVLIKSLTSSEYSGGINIVTNFVKGSGEGRSIYEKLNSVSQKFLDIKIDYLGYINRDDVVSSAVRSQKPFIMSHPRKRASKQIEEIAAKIVSGETMNDEREMSFAEKLFNIFTGN